MRPQRWAANTRPPPKVLKILMARLEYMFFVCVYISVSEELHLENLQKLPKIHAASALGS